MKNISCEVKQFSFLGKRFSLLLLYVCMTIASMGQNVKWALVDTKGIYPFHDGIACFSERKGGYGGINRNGKVVIQPIYESSFSFKDGAAIVQLKDKMGIINVAGVYLLKPEYKYIGEEKEAKGLYEVKDSIGNSGLFFNNRLILPCKYKFLSTYSFPLINVTEQNGSYYYVNILNGRIYEYCTSQGALLIAKNKEREDCYLKGSGEQVDKASLLRSSKGLEAYYDESTMKYGFKDGKTGQIIVPARYFGYNTAPFWYHDVMILRTDTLKNAVEVMIGANGNEMLKSKEGQYIKVLDEKYVQVGDRYVSGKEGCIGLYSIDGKVILPVKYYTVNPIVKDWFQIMDSPYPSTDLRLFNAKSKRFYDGGDPEFSDGMFRTIVKKNGHYFHGYVDMETEYEIPTIYTSATKFSGGLAIVEQDDKTFAIDKRGNVVLSENAQFTFRTHSDDGFSEGVVGAYDKISYTDGYIYNPLGNEGYTYNTTGTASDKTIERWMAEGHTLFNARNYVKAKDYFYRVLMSAPSNVLALSNYASCLNNMGYYDEAIEAYRMALDIDPDDDYAKKNLQIALDNRQAREDEANGNNVEEDSSKSGTFWDALGNFCSVLGNMMGGASNYL